MPINPDPAAIRAFFASRPVPVTTVRHPLLDQRRVRLLVQHEYALDDAISGNKWRKLKHNLLAAATARLPVLVTMGGAYSNHLAAVAAAGRRFGFRTFGFVRGEMPEPLNPTLRYCVERGMQLHYYDRTAYRQLRTDARFLAQAMRALPGGSYWLPEGGTNQLAVKGCTEMWGQWQGQSPPDVVAVCAGTGGTAAGLIAGAPASARVEVYPALKGNWMAEEIRRWIPGEAATDWALVSDHHFGGYAKTTPTLLHFIRTFRRATGIPLDPIYTGKLFYGLFDRIERGLYPSGITLLAIHTGGLQGIAGFETRTGESL